jgi:Na+/pantothenate symporter
MEKRLTGVVFCFIAAMLFVSRYVSAAIFMSGVSSWSSELFNAGLEYVGMPLLVLSIISFVVGVGYLFMAEKSDREKK